MSRMNANCAEGVRCQRTPTGKSGQPQEYQDKPRKSRAFTEIIPDRRPPLPPANSMDQARHEWLSRAGDVLSAFIVNLDSQHLSQAERQDGWRVFESLLSAYVSRKRGLSQEAA